jgi:hypothetical protein
VNGIFSVLGPVVAVALSMTWGIRMLLLISSLVYLVVGRLRPETWPEVPGESDGSVFRSADQSARGVRPESVA